jgi:hypothetical protein
MPRHIVVASIIAAPHPNIVISLADDLGLCGQL